MRPIYFITNPRYNLNSLQKKDLYGLLRYLYEKVQSAASQQSRTCLTRGNLCSNIYLFLSNCFHYHKWNATLPKWGDRWERQFETREVAFVYYWIYRILFCSLCVLLPWAQQYITAPGQMFLSWKHMLSKPQRKWAILLCSFSDTKNYSSTSPYTFYTTAKQDMPGNPTDLPFVFTVLDSAQYGSGTHSLSLNYQICTIFAKRTVSS